LNFSVSEIPVWADTPSLRVIDPRDERGGSGEESISGERVGTRGTREDARGKNDVRRFRPPPFKGLNFGDLNST